VVCTNLHTFGTCSSCIFKNNFANMFFKWGQILISCPNLTSIFIFKIWSSSIPSNFTLEIIKISIIPNCYSIALVDVIHVSLQDSFFLFSSW
jgi:hypothetical protein